MLNHDPAGDDSPLHSPTIDLLGEMCVCGRCCFLEFERRLAAALATSGFSLWKPRLRRNTYFIENSLGARWALFTYHPGLDPLLTRWQGVGFGDDDGTVHSIILTVLFEMSGQMNLLDEAGSCSTPQNPLGGGGDAA